MRVVSWNIELGADITGAIECLTTRRELQGLDVLLAQELDPAGAAALARALDADHVYEASATHPKTGRPFGNAVISRRPISDHQGVDLPHQAKLMGVARGATGAVVDGPFGPVWCWSVHAEIPLLRLSLRRRQFARVASAAVADTSAPIIIGGDFNTAGPRSRAHLAATMRSAGLDPLLDARHVTLTRRGVGFHLDHLFGRQVEARSSGVSPAHSASDHFPVYADLEPISRRG